MTGRKMTGREKTTRRAASRAGFSLLEMMLATALLLGSTIVLSELVGIGTQHVDDVEGLSTAQVLCQSTLNAMLSGAAETESYEARAISKQPGWMVSSEVTSVRQEGVALLRVTVWYQEPGQQKLDLDLPMKYQFSLVRRIRDPYKHLPTDTSSNPFPSSLLQPSSLMDQIGGDPNL